MIRESDASTIWTRLHARQALVLGVMITLAYLLLLALPLIAVLVIPSISTAGTIAVYSTGFAADVIVGCAVLVLGVRYAVRAARGELFSIPIVTPVVERCFPLHRR